MATDGAEVLLRLQRSLGRVEALGIVHGDGEGLHQPGEAVGVLEVHVLHLQNTSPETGVACTRCRNIAGGQLDQRVLQQGLVISPSEQATPSGIVVSWENSTLPPAHAGGQDEKML